jgi:hypothetical protein
MNPENNSQEPEVQLTESKAHVLHTVTPLSKYLAMALFIILPFVGGWIGYNYSSEKVAEGTPSNDLVADESGGVVLSSEALEYKKVDNVDRFEKLKNVQESLKNNPDLAVTKDNYSFINQITGENNQIGTAYSPSYGIKQIPMGLTWLQKKSDTFSVTLETHKPSGEVTADVVARDVNTDDLSKQAIYHVYEWTPKDEDVESVYRFVFDMNSEEDLKVSDYFVVTEYSQEIGDSQKTRWFNQTFAWAAQNAKNFYKNSNIEDSKSNQVSLSLSNGETVIRQYQNDDDLLALISELEETGLQVKSIDEGSSQSYEGFCDVIGTKMLNDYNEGLYDYIEAGFLSKITEFDGYSCLESKDKFAISMKGKSSVWDEMDDGTPITVGFETSSLCLDSNEFMSGGIVDENAITCVEGI